MKIAVVVNPYIKDLKFKNKIVDSIKSNSKFDVFELFDSSEINDSFDKVLVFGGDGTILRASKFAAIYNIPVLGIDLGHLGFLAQFDKTTKIDDIINALNSFEYDERTLLSGSIGNKDTLALNEIVIKSSQTKPIYLDLFIDGEYVDSYHSDGIIVSTPTGSTAYSLSAGGPVLAPSLDAMLIIPICPHSLHSRSMVISSSSKIEIKLKKYISANISVDGNEFSTFETEQSIVIEKSKYNAKFVVKKDVNFYKKLLEKMNKWGITE